MCALSRDRDTSLIVWWCLANTNLQSLCGAKNSRNVCVLATSLPKFRTLVRDVIFPSALAGALAATTTLAACALALTAAATALLTTTTVTAIAAVDAAAASNATAASRVATNAAGIPPTCCATAAVSAVRLAVDTIASPSTSDSRLHHSGHAEH